MLNRPIAITALASFLAIGTQSAFADPAPTEVTTTATSTTTTTAPAAASSQPGTQAAISTPAKPARARHVARIPGTFAVADQDLWNSARAMLTPLSGDGGG
jgi:hypothetical protein